MLWNLCKKLFLFMLIGMGVAAALFHFSPKTFNDKVVERCSTKTSGMGLCAGKKLSKGSTIGLVVRIDANKNKPESTEYGSLIRQSKDQTNITLQPLYINDKMVDFYGYTTRDIDEGEEIIRPTGL